jgi:hypothetical protein
MKRQYFSEVPFKPLTSGCDGSIHRCHLQANQVDAQRSEGYRRRGPSTIELVCNMQNPIMRRTFF